MDLLFAGGLVVGGLAVGALAAAGVALIIWLFSFLQAQNKLRAEVEAQIEQLELKIRSQKGVAAREQYSSRRQAALLEAQAQISSGKSIDQALLETAKKYPDVAAQAAQNPDILLTEIKRLGITLPPELLDKLGAGGNAPPPESSDWPST